MGRIRSLLRLSARDLWLLITSALLLVAIQSGLKFLPFQTVQRLLTRISQSASSRQAADRRSIGRVVWAVDTVSRHIPGISTCLTRGLVAQALLCRYGHPAQLRIGVAHSDAKQLQAHAWVEIDDTIVLGGLQDLARYVPFPLLDKEGRERHRWHLFP